MGPSNLDARLTQAGRERLTKDDSLADRSDRAVLG